MAKIPENVATTGYLLNTGQTTQKPRPYLGMSQNGDPCDRKLWLGFHWAVSKQIPKRIMRIFRTGNDAEAKIIDDLEQIGIEVSNQQAKIEGFAGHEFGHIDGECVGVPEAPKTVHLLEMKTHNDRSFKQLVKQGVKLAKPMHYAQCMRYMGGRNLTRALYVAINKNDETYHVERIKFNQGYYDELVKRGRDIILAEQPPGLMFARTWYECKWCDFHNLCHQDGEVQRNCRTCAHSDMLDDGVWECGLSSTQLPDVEQRIGCAKWRDGVDLGNS